MIKLFSYETVFREVPGEVTLALNLSMCPHHCDECHSPWLWSNEGAELTIDLIDSILLKNKHKAVTCLAFMGGDNDPEEVMRLNELVKEKHPNLKTCWYTGFSYGNFSLRYSRGYKLFDYLKFGKYIKELGGLDNPNTNQAFFKVSKSGLMTRMNDVFQKHGISAPIEQ